MKTKPKYRIAYPYNKRVRPHWLGPVNFLPLCTECRKPIPADRNNTCHEWVPRVLDWEDVDGARCSIPFCDAQMDDEEMSRRLNEYETLKKATEDLSAEDMEYIGGIVWGSWKAKEQKSQEPMLEDSEMQVRLESAVEREKKLMRKCIAYANILEGK